MKTRRWLERAVRTALVLGVLGSVPFLVLFFDVPAALLAACGDYYFTPAPCGGCTDGEERPLCCIVVRAPFHPINGSPLPPDCCGLTLGECCPTCEPTPPCDDSCGLNASAAEGAPTSDGTTGLCATPKYKSTQVETVTFSGFVRVCPENAGQALPSWLCAATSATVFLDGAEHKFIPDCCDVGLTNVYFGGSGWRDYLCPVEIGLGPKLQDGKWHLLQIAYTNNVPGGLNVHKQCHEGGLFQGVTLYLGCPIQVRESGLKIPRIATPTKFQRVNLYGVPVSERSPTGEAETDEPQNGFFVDMYNLAPTASFPEMSIPLEGGELALEFRRDGGYRQAHTSIHTGNLPITYPTDDLMGLGWSTNLAARAIISRSGGGCDADPPRVTITDAGGTAYNYLLESGNKFRPEVYDSQSNAAVRATAAFVPNPLGQNLVLTLKHGTKYSYSKVGDFLGGNTDSSQKEEYWRLDSVTDRNGNQIVYSYTFSGTGYFYPLNKMLVSSIKEAARPERELTFLYEDALPWQNQNGYDWGVRLTKVTDPLARSIEYFYTLKVFPDPLSMLPTNVRQRLLLTSVKYPQVKDGESGPMLNPMQFYDYELRVTLGAHINGQVASLARVLHAGLKEAWQNAEAAKTSFEYNPAEELFPVAVHPLAINGQPLMNVEYQPVMTLKKVTTADGSETQFSTQERVVGCAGQCPALNTPLGVHTRVLDPRGVAIDYQWTGEIRPLDEEFDPPDPENPQKLFYWNQVEFAAVISWVERTTWDGATPYRVLYGYTNDLFGNLYCVEDMSGNLIKYEYGGPGLESRISNQPTIKIVYQDPEDPQSTLQTVYAYGAFHKLVQLTDPEGKVTAFTLDANGNRIEATNHAGAPLGTRTTAFTYAANGFVTSTTDAEERLTTFLPPVFAPGSNLEYYTVTSIADPAGLNLKTVKIYDKVGNLTKEIAPQGFVAGEIAEDHATKYQYDALNRLTLVEKPKVAFHSNSPPATWLESTVEESFYDLKGNLKKKKAARAPAAAPGGQDLVSTSYTYDIMNRLLTTQVPLVPNPTNPDQIIETEKRYNNMGLVAEEVDAKGHVVKFTYDALLRLKEKEFAVTLEPGGQPVPLKEKYQYEFEGQSRNAGSGAFNYSTAWKPIRVTNPRGFATDSAYDGLYRPVRVVRRRYEGNLDGLDPWTPARDEGGGLAAEPRERTGYDAASKPVWHEVAFSNGALEPPNPLFFQKTYTFYDGFDRPTAVVLDLNGDGNGGPDYSPATLIVNDASQFSADPNDIVTRTMYDLTDKVTKVIDPNGQLSEKQYDLAGRVVLEVGADLDPGPGTAILRPAVKTAYDANGAVVEKRGPYPVVTEDPPSETPSGSLTRSFYDRQGRLEKTIEDLDGDAVAEDTDDIAAKIRYDLIGNRIEEIDARGNATAFEYDAANRKVKVKGPEVWDVEPNPDLLRRPETEFAYDKNGNVTAIWDPRDVKTEFEYDELNRVVLERKAAGVSGAEFVTEKVYDGNGNIIRLIAQNQPVPQVTTYEFDAFDRPVEEILPGTPLAVKTMEYYRDGKLLRATDPEGQKVEYAYDLARRTVQSVQKKASGTTEETRVFEYDLAGNLVLVTDGSGQTRYIYDALYRVREEERRTAGGALIHEVLSEYDLEGKRTKITYPGTNRILIQAYDPAGRLVTITDTLPNPDLTTAYEYDKNGNVTRLASSPPTYIIEALNTYDALNRLESRDTATAAAGAVFSADYSYDIAGNVRRLVEEVAGEARDVTYIYDERYRLTQEFWTGNIYSYEYDLVGNRLKKIIAIQGQPTETSTYAYSLRNELQSVNVTGGTPSTATFTHDLNGNRETKAAGSVTTNYTWDVSNRLVSVDNGGPAVFQATYDYRTRRLKATNSGTTLHYVYDGGLCIQERPTETGSPSNELINGAGLGGGIGGVLYEVRGSTRRHFVYNQVGHTVAEVGSDGAVLGSSRYEAFGNRFDTGGSSPNKRLANTKELDSSTGLYNHGFRYYDPGLGRYISRDPLGYADGPNVYLYVHNNPVVRIDPEGLQEKKEKTVTVYYKPPSPQERVRAKQLDYAQRHEADAKRADISEMQRQSHQRMADALRAGDLAAYEREMQGSMALLEAVTQLGMTLTGYMGLPLGHRGASVGRGVDRARAAASQAAVTEGVGAGVAGRVAASSADDAVRTVSPSGCVTAGSKASTAAAPEFEAIFAPRGAVHKNSLEHVGETHVYRIKSPDGTTYKIGESAQGTRVGDGASIRAEGQVRGLNREVGPGHSSEIRRTFPDKASAREYETKLIERFRRMYGEDTLPGNKTNR